MTNYVPPLIETIEDVIPAIIGQPEFSIKFQPYGIVVGYHVQFEHTFPDLLSDGHWAAIRRECRGIVFDPETGVVTSRPLHKFFNVNERDETRQEKFDFSTAQVLEKLDGSMIRNIRIGNYYRLGTKAGITDIAMQAERFVARHPTWNNFFQIMTAFDYTVICEYTSPNNRIVVKYDEPNLTLLAIRDNVTGMYHDREMVEHYGATYDIPIVGSSDLYSGLLNNEIIASIRDRDQEEGYVLVMKDEQTRLKIKNDWYIGLHKSKDEISREKNVVKAILNQTLDDLRPTLIDTDLQAINSFERKFLDGLLQTAIDIGIYFDRLMSMVEEGDIRSRRKEFAQAMKFKQNLKGPNSKYSLYQNFLFQVFPVKEDQNRVEFVLDILRQHLLKSCSTQTLVDENRHLWGGARYTYGNITE